MSFIKLRTVLACAAAFSLTGIAVEPAFGQAERYRYLQGGENYAAVFLNSSQGIVTRDGGGALFSDDGGLSWDEAFVPDSVRKQLRNLFVLDSDQVWSVGGGGVVVSTSNRGESWIHRNLNAPVENELDQPASLYDIWMFDDLNGICVGEVGALARTDNGWLTWEPVGLPTDFYDENSTDPLLNEPGDIYRVHFFDADKGLLTADNGRILRTFDGGANWVTSSFSGYCGHVPTGDLELWGLSASGSDVWIAGGNTAQNGHAFFSDDSGHSWQQIRFIVPIDATVEAAISSGTGAWPTIYGVAALGNGSAVLSGYAGWIHEFNPSGSQGQDAVNRCLFQDPPAPTTQPTLHHVHPAAYAGPGLDPGRPPLNGAFALSSSERWVAGQFGAIKRWNDSTDVWEERGTAAQTRFRDLDFVSASVGVVAGQGHRIFKTEDGGQTLDLVYEGTSNEHDMLVVGLARGSSQLGLAGGGNAFFVRTDDAGDTWTPVNTPHIIPTSLDFGGTSDVAFVGASGGHIFSTDVSVLSAGDLIWTSRILPDLEHTVTGLAFIDEDTGYAVTTGMKIYSTSNGGSSWSTVGITNRPSTQALRAVATFGDGSKAIAVGAAGSVLVRNGTNFQVVDLSSLIGLTQLNTVTVLGGGTRIVAAGNDGVVVEFEGSTFADALNPSNWSTPKSMTDLHIFAVSFDAVDHGFVLGQQGLIIEYD